MIFIVFMPLPAFGKTERAFVYLFTSFAIFCSKHLINSTLLTLMRPLWYAIQNDERRDVVVGICNCRAQHRDNAHTLTHLTWLFFVLFFIYSIWMLEVMQCIVLVFDKSEVKVVYRKNLANLCDKINASQRLSLIFFFSSLFMCKGNKIFPRSANWNNIVAVCAVWCSKRHHSSFLNAGRRQMRCWSLNTSEIFINRRWVKWSCQSIVVVGTMRVRTRRRQ